MNKRWYILIETNSTDSTFVESDNNITRYYEIYYVPTLTKENLNIENSAVLVQAVNQVEAFNKFKANNFILKKYINKDYYEKALWI